MGKVLDYEKQRRGISSVFLSPATKISIELGDALEKYEKWPRPTVIISDGPYGLGKFPGDPVSADTLGEIYAPHVAAWSKYATPATTLWFWCSEVGWAEVHLVLKLHGWNYRAAHIWDKGIGHVAGNCNSDTIRGFPVVSEICVQYVRDVKLPDSTGHLLPIKKWLRSEWQRSGLPLTKTNEACGVKNAATRKYFTQCHLWYFPPPEKMEMLASFATKHGRKTDTPYFSLDRSTALTAEQWAKLRPKWNHAHGITNVWQEPTVRGDERIKKFGLKSLHANQKPLKLLERTIVASSDINDVVWEPFGGLCSSAIASLHTNRSCYSSEILPDFFDVATERLMSEYKETERNGTRKNTKSA